MKSLEKKILVDGQVLPGGILKVGSFLNQQIDSDFLMEMGREIARLYEDCGITKIMTVESSGIAIALAAGAVIHVPVLFAKKHKSGNVSGDVLKTKIHSFTHGNDYEAVVAKEYLKADDRVLIVDDFLASGEAINGLLDLIGQAGAGVVGVAVAIEKGFQGGGDKLRKSGVRVEALALIDSMNDNGEITFR